MQCGCGAEIALSDIVRKCAVCRKRICSECMSAKIGTGQRFLCPDCARTSKEYPRVHVSNDIRGSDVEAFIAWAVMVKNHEDDILLLEVDDKQVMAYNRDIDQVVRVADRLSADRFLSLDFYIGRVWVPKDTVYAPVFIKIFGDQDIRILRR